MANLPDYMQNRPTTQGGQGYAMDGISAVNPQATAPTQQYVTASFENVLRNMAPIWAEQQADYTQQMINQGIPVGSEAHDKSLNALYDSQNDTRANAAFDAMAFGLGAQNQDFQQALARSQLANSLLQSEWGNETAQYGISTEASTAAAALAEQARQADMANQFDIMQLNSLNQQFGDTLGFNYANLYGDLGLSYDTLGAQYGLAYDALAQQAHEFESGLDYDYWNQGNQFSYLDDRANMSDLQWFADQGRQDYYDSLNESRYYDGLLMALLSGGAGAPPPVPIWDPNSAYGANQSAQVAANNNANNFWAAALGGLLGG